MTGIEQINLEIYYIALGLYHKQQLKMKPKYDTTTLAGKIAVMEMYQCNSHKLLVRAPHERGWTKWNGPCSPVWNWEANDYNFPAESKLIPWTLKTVPKDPWMLIRSVHYSDGEYYRVAGFGESHFRLIFCDACVQYKAALTEWQHSLDGGKTWLPCGTVEE